VTLAVPRRAGLAIEPMNGSASAAAASRRKSRATDSFYGGRPAKQAVFMFTSERGAPFTTAGFARMVERAGSEAKLGFKAHPHMRRHACGYANTPHAAR
jgi:site-specific recombinase XerD